MMTNENKRDTNSEDGGSVIGVLASLVLVALLVKGCDFLTSEANVTKTSEIVNNTYELSDRNLKIYEQQLIERKHNHHVRIR